MKKVVFSLLLFCCTVVMAMPVQPERARQVAQQLCSIHGQPAVDLVDMSVQLSKAIADTADDMPAIYLFVLSQGGFVIVSGDDCVEPILGYSFTSDFSTQAMPAHVKDWLVVYRQQIEVLRTYPVDADAAVRDRWQHLENEQEYESTLSSSVSPLLTTTWDQYPYYNDQCPYDNDEEVRVVTGCVATATAQIMKYWNHPATGRGSHSYTHSTYGYQSADFGATTYQWSNMPDALSASSTTEQVNAVAQLMYHVGVALEMDYGTLSSGGSGAFTTGGLHYANAMQALMSYFGYQSTMYAVQLSYYTNDQWSLLLRSNLDAGQPILYSGADPSGGHSFVLDGYDTDGRFHVNWGWGGYCNGYYVVGSLNPSAGGAGGNSTYTFNLRNAAVLGIVPQANPGTTTTVVATADNSSHASVSGSGTYNNFTDTIRLVANTQPGYRFISWSDGSDDNPRELLATGGTINLTANTVSIGTDTISYSARGCINTIGYGHENSTFNWGIRIPSSSLRAGRRLDKVRLYVTNPCQYTLHVFEGTTDPDSLIHTQQYNSSASLGWEDIVIDTALCIDANKSLWVTFSVSGISYPATYTLFSGCYDGMLYNSSSYSDYDNWVPLSQGTFLVTWMIDALFDTAIFCHVTATSNDSRYGTVTGTGTYVSGSTVTLKAIANEHCNFLQWTDGSVENPRVITVTSDCTYNAIFDIDRYTITAVSSNASRGTVTGGGTYEWGEEVALEAIPAEGYHFNRWSDFNSENPRPVVVEADATYEARFSKNSYTVSLSVNDDSYGYVGGEGTYSHGDTAVLQAFPYEGYRFERWSDGVVDNPRRMAITSDVSLTAYLVDSHTGIDDVAVLPVTYSMHSDILHVDGVAGRWLLVADIAGRVLFSGTCNEVSVKLPSSGIYLLQVDGNMTAKIAVHF